MKAKANKREEIVFDFSREGNDKFRYFGEHIPKDGIYSITFYGFTNRNLETDTWVMLAKRKGDKFIIEEITFPVGGKSITCPIVLKCESGVYKPLVLQDLYDFQTICEALKLVRNRNWNLNIKLNTNYWGTPSEDNR